MLHKKQQYVKDVYGKEPETLDEIAESVIAVLNRIKPVVGFQWNMNFQQAVSNSHNAPLDGYRNWSQNNKQGNIRSYPGYYGRVWIRFIKEPDFMRLSDNFAKSLTYTGTGGGGSYNGPWEIISGMRYQAQRILPRKKISGVYCYSWDYRFFLSDFPNLKEGAAIEALEHYKEEEGRRVWAKLEKKYYSEKQYKHSHHFSWEDSTIQAEDEKFSEEYRKYLAEE